MILLQTLQNVRLSITHFGRCTMFDMQICGGKCAKSPSYEMNQNTLSDVMRDVVNGRIPGPDFLKLSCDNWCIG